MKRTGETSSSRPATNRTRRTYLKNSCCTAQNQYVHGARSPAATGTLLPRHANKNMVLNKMAIKLRRQKGARSFVPIFSSAFFFFFAFPALLFVRDGVCCLLPLLPLGSANRSRGTRCRSFFFCFGLPPVSVVSVIYLWLPVGNVVRGGQRYPVILGWAGGPLFWYSVDHGLPMADVWLLKEPSRADTEY